MVRFILRGVEWISSPITKTDISSLGDEGRETIAGHTYIRISGEGAKKCWWCHQDLGKNSYSLPLKTLSEPNSTLNLAKFHGRPCAKAYCMDNFQKHPGIFTKALATIEDQNRAETKTSNLVSEAPPWTFLKDYGGPWSVSQYQENLELGLTYSLNVSQHTNSTHHVACSSYYREYS